MALDNCRGREVPISPFEISMYYAAFISFYDSVQRTDLMQFLGAQKDDIINLLTNRQGAWELHPGINFPTSISQEQLTLKAKMWFQFIGDKYKAKIKPSKERELEEEEDPREDLEEDHKEEPKSKPSKLNEASDPYFDQ
ncbi:hypothetical protein Gotur_035646 [Gossypium turneri]